MTDTQNYPQVELNPVGDVILNDVRQLEALADPERLTTFEWLQRHGPSTSEELGAALDRTSTSVTSSLAPLEAAGLVHRADGSWQAHGRGLFLQLPDDDADAAAAARSLSNVMLLATEKLPRRWVEEVEPQLDARWAGAAGLFNANAVITAAELAELQEHVEELLEPFLNRDASEVPGDARKVRLLAYFLPSGQPDEVVAT